MSKRVRHALVTAHVVASVGWMGAGAVNVVLAMIAMRTGDFVVRSVNYRMIERIDAYLVIPLAFAALATGVVVSLVTTWGLTRYWWVLVKLVLTVAVIVYSTFGVGVWVQESITATKRGSQNAVAAHLAYGAALNVVAFLFMTWLSVAKPWGLTPWTRRPLRRP